MHNVTVLKLKVVSENTHKSPGVIALACLKKKGLITSRTSSIPTFPGSNNSVALKIMIDPSAPPPLMICFIGISGETKQV